jgi:hypothetical protein
MILKLLVSILTKIKIVIIKMNSYYHKGGKRSRKQASRKSI